MTEQEKQQVMEALGNVIRTRRLALKRSQAAIARSARITQASLSNYENGKRDMPFTTFLAIASALGATPGNLTHEAIVHALRSAA